MRQRLRCGRVEKSVRLQKTLHWLRMMHRPTTRDLQVKTRSMSVHSDVFDLRQLGYRVEAVYDRKTKEGNRIYRWKLFEKPQI